MRLIFSVIIIFLIAAFSAPPVYAIIFLPAIVLIPIAKIVALIIGGFSFPALGVGTIWSKLFGKSLRKTLTVIIIALVIFGIISIIFLRIHNPERPLF